MPFTTSKRRSPPGPRRWWTLATIGLVTGLIAGCMQEISRTSSWDNFPGAQKSRQSDTPVLFGNWAIALERFEGANRFRDAYRLVRRLNRESDLGDLWYADDGTASTVYHGRFRSPRLPDATQALTQVRSAKLNGETLFAEARFVDVSGAREATATADPKDLKQHAGFYSLQIGYYDSKFGDGFRNAAEEAAAALREDGTEAYFYHGQNISMVTVGLFTADDFVTRQGIRGYGPRIKSAQDEFPFHTANGRTVIVRKGGREDKLRSSLVRVP
ncbi:MAG: hypothetical protein AAF750_08155 [Planctomycetota bacterium]